MLNVFQLFAPPQFPNYIVIGCGQQGASILRTLAKTKGKHTLTTYDTSEERRDELASVLKGDGTNDRIKISENLSDALSQAKSGDIIVLATPIDKFAEIVKNPAMQEAIKRGVILTDVGSAKAESIHEISKELPEGAKFVPAHPIVGSAGQGASTSSLNMYAHETIAIIPTTDRKLADAQVAVEKMWKSIGANIKHMSAFQHDTVLASISHYEHFGIAFPLTDTMQASDNFRENGKFALLTTRIANASAPMWNAVAIHNRANILLAHDRVTEKIESLKEALMSKEQDKLKALIKDACSFRFGVIEPKPRLRADVTTDMEDEIYKLRQEGYGLPDANPKDVASLTAKFKDMSEVGYVRRIALPYLASAALTLNAKDVQEETGVLIQGGEGLRNPSFCDGSSAMLSSPQKIVDLLWANKEELLKEVEKFQQQQERWIDMVRNGDQNLSSEIDGIAEKRKSLPAHFVDTELAERYVAPYHNTGVRDCPMYQLNN